MQTKLGYSSRSLWLRSLVVFFPLMFLVSCGGKHSITNPPPVSAQQGYSNASLNGSYAISGMIAPGCSGGASPNCPGTYAQYGVPLQVSTMQFDGGGKITGGTFTFPLPEVVFDGFQSYNLTGAYSISSNGSGTATIQFAFQDGEQPDPLITATSYQFSLEVAQQGGAVMLTNNMPSASQNTEFPMISLTGLKQ